MHSTCDGADARPVHAHHTGYSSTLFPLESGSDVLTWKALGLDHEVGHGARDPGDSTARHG